MRLRHIEVFHAVYTTGSVTSAAKKLYVSQPSVSKVLSHAEQQLGFQLFDRIKGRLVSTKEADLLFIEVDRIYKQLINVNDAAENIKHNEVGHITIAISPALGFDIVPAACVNFKKNHPKVSIKIQTIHNDRVLNHLQRHQSELAILFSPDKFSGLNESQFGDGKMVAVYSKKMLPSAPDKITLEELLQYPLISIWDSGPLADLVWQKVVKESLKPISSIKVQTYFIAVSLVKHGAGICIVDEFTARSQLNGNVGIAELAGDFNFPIKALHLENKPLSSVAQQLIGYIKEEFNSFKAICKS